MHQVFLLVNGFWSFTSRFQAFLHCWLLISCLGVKFTNRIYYLTCHFFKGFQIWNFYFLQISTGIVEKKHVLTPFNFIFKFSHCLTLFPIFLVHVNWIVFYITRQLFKFCYQQILHSNESWIQSNNSAWIWKMIVNKTQKSIDSWCGYMFQLNFVKSYRENFCHWFIFQQPLCWVLKEENLYSNNFPKP